MKIKEELISKIKKLVITSGSNAMVWIDFVAESNGRKYISGHNIHGNSITVCSDGKIYDKCEYKAGNFLIEGHNLDINFKPVSFRDIIIGYNVKFITDDPQNVQKYISEFEINIEQ